MKSIMETDRLILRQMEWSDLGDLKEMLFDPRVMYAYEHNFTVRQGLPGRSVREKRYWKSAIC